MQTDSLCLFPTCPGRAVCRACAVIANPRPLNSGDLRQMTGGLASSRTQRAVGLAVSAGVGARGSYTAIDQRDDARKAEREAALRAEIERTKAEIARLSTRRAVGLHPAPVADPEVTAPNPPQVVLAPAPAPILPASFKALQVGDWAGLAARVEAGAISKEQAERIASEWMAAPQLGVMARA